MKNLNSKNNVGDYYFLKNAAATDEKAVAFACDVVRGTIKAEYGVCQQGATVEGAGNVFPLTPMQEMKAKLLSDPSSEEAIAYLTPRVGADHVEKLKACGRLLKKNKDVVLALAPAASGSRASKKPRSS